MKTQLQKASTDYATVEAMLDIEDSCWHLITLLWKLDVISYDSSNIEDDFDSFRYGHQRSLVDVWYRLYMELSKS